MGFLDKAKELAQQAETSINNATGISGPKSADPMLKSLGQWVYAERMGRAPQASTEIEALIAQIQQVESQAGQLPLPTPTTPTPPAGVGAGPGQYAAPAPGFGAAPDPAAPPMASAPVEPAAAPYPAAPAPEYTPPPASYPAAPVPVYTPPPAAPPPPLNLPGSAPEGPGPQG